ncbi:hypothetical protein B0H19DRAFT_1204792 [Mycena capillaripes]|nr:hypothetical protein B0H19DRAFT_1204792 [Mycena capillaripes]
MHLIFENVIKNLVLLWTGNYKGLDEGTGDYEIHTSVWEAIGAATAAGGSTIPTAFGARPPDIIKDRTACTAETWSFWLLYLGPALLHNKFTRRVYYDHFINFVKLIHLCLQFKYSKGDIAQIRTGFAQWVQQYEKLYYQYSPSRLSTCPLTIHALLHIADGIEAAGPVWAYWAFPMERFCGRLQPCIKSRRFPFASIDGHVVAMAQLSIVKVQHALDLCLGPPKVELANGAFQHPSCTCALLPPRRLSGEFNPLDAELARKIVICLATRYDQSLGTIRKYFDANGVEQWGKVQRLDGGDRMLASSMIAEAEDRRDATYVRYALLVDVNARRARLAPKFELVTFYGQLQNIFVITAKNDLDMHYYQKNGPVEVVDITTIQCLVGRMKTTDNRHWVLLDRSGTLARPYHDADS